MKFYVLANEEIVTGFNYVGVEGEEIITPEQAKEAFTRIKKMSDVGVLIITEKIADMLHEEFLKWQIESLYPLIVEIPDFSGHIKDRPTLVDAIKEAIGISV